MAEDNKNQEEGQEESTEEDNTSSSDEKNEESETVETDKNNKEGDEETTETDEEEQSDNESDADKKDVPYSRFKEVNDKYKAVKAELDQLKGESSNQEYETEETTETNDTVENNELESYKTAFNEVYQSKLNAVPEEYKDLIPEGDDLSKFKWIESAIAKGLFDVKKAESFGNQGNNPAEQETQDTSNFIRNLGRKF